MTEIKIKICGVNSITIAEAALQAGADYLGVVFHHSSPRHIKSLDLARNINMLCKKKSAHCVAVFANYSSTMIRSICSQTGINHVQLHGQSGLDDLTMLSSFTRILAIKVEKNGSYYLKKSRLAQLNPKKDFILFDSPSPGSGQPFNHNKFIYEGVFNYFVAGGLNSMNIKSCLTTLIPYGLDASSGLESSPGIKSIKLIKQFIEQVNHVNT